MDEIEKLMAELESDDPGRPIKTYTQLLAEGHPHKGGLAQLAAAEQAGTLFGSPGPASTDSSSEQASPFPSGPEDDLLVKWMTKRSIPVTRENYLQVAYPEGTPIPWTAELEAQLPKELQQPLPESYPLPLGGSSDRQVHPVTGEAPVDIF
jgi:hypothetical protein